MALIKKKPNPVYSSTDETARELYRETNDNINSKLDKGNVSEDYNTAKKIEDKITTTKDNLVNAINEVDAKASSRGDVDEVFGFFKTDDVITMPLPLSSYQKFTFIISKVDKSYMCSHTAYLEDIDFFMDNSTDSGLRYLMVLYDTSYITLKARNTSAGTFTVGREYYDVRILKVIGYKK
jgi:hypothetical protein